MIVWVAMLFITEDTGEIKHDGKVMRHVFDLLGAKGLFQILLDK